MVNLANGYMRVFYNEENIGIEYYDKNFNIQSRKNIKLHAFMEEEKSFSMISFSMRFLKELSRKFIKMLLKNNWSRTEFLKMLSFQEK